jgi:hypothetical protein
MKTNGLTRVVIHALAFLVLSGCATSPQSGQKATQAEFQPLLGTWARVTANWVDVLEIEAISPTGRVAATFLVQRKGSYLDYKELPQYWFTMTEATARVEDGEIKVLLKFNDRNFPWSYFDLTLWKHSLIDMLGGFGFYTPNGHKIMVVSTRR